VCYEGFFYIGSDDRLYALDSTTGDGAYPFEEGCARMTAEITYRSDSRYSFRVNEIEFEVRGYPQGHLYVFTGYQRDGEQQDFTFVPYEQDEFAWAASQLYRMGGWKAKEVRVLIGNEKRLVWREKLRKLDTATVVGPLWGIAANVKMERFVWSRARAQLEPRLENRHFAPGSKVYPFPPTWGDGYQQIYVLGQRRGSPHFTKIVISSAWLTDWRVELITFPPLIRALWPDWNGTDESKSEAQALVDGLLKREIDESESIRNAMAADARDDTSAGEP
jgi:hypothetical protein